MADLVGNEALDGLQEHEEDECDEVGGGGRRCLFYEGELDDGQDVY